MIQLPEGISRQDLETMIDLFSSWGKKHQTEGMIEVLSYFLTISGWKQRAEAAEDALAEEKRMTSKLIQDRAVMARECNAFEAKLAELEKQEPIFQVEVSGNHWLNAGPVDDTDFTGLPDGINRLYARPAPAIKLADLAGLDKLAGEMLGRSLDSAGKQALAYADCAHILAKHAAMLRNIEEKSK